MSENDKQTTTENKQTDKINKQKISKTVRCYVGIKKAGHKPKSKRLTKPKLTFTYIRKSKNDK